jgi:hypothetical protein
MNFQLPALLAALASRDDGAAALLMRLSSMILCIGSLIASGIAFKLYGNVFTDGFGEVWSLMLIIFCGIVMLWTSIYLILTSLHVRIVYPVTITFELLSWLLALSVALTVSTSTLWGQLACTYGDCSDWRKVLAAVAVSCALLFVVT